MLSQFAGVQVPGLQHPDGSGSSVELGDVLATPLREQELAVDQRLEWFPEEVPSDWRVPWKLHGVGIKNAGVWSKMAFLRAVEACPWVDLLDRVQEIVFCFFGMIKCQQCQLHSFSSLFQAFGTLLHLW